MEKKLQRNTPIL